MVTNWHDISEQPEHDRLCIIRVANNRKKLDYQIARFRKNWVYKTDKRVTDQVLSWSYINER